MAPNPIISQIIFLCDITLWYSINYCSPGTLLSKMILLSRKLLLGVKKTTEAEGTSSDSDGDYIYLQHTAQHLHRVKKIRPSPSQDTVLIRIGDIDAFVEPGSGASTNAMDEYQFKALKHRSQEIKELEPSRDTLKILQSDLTVKGEFTTTLRNKNRGTQSKFLVIPGKMDSPPPPPPK